MPTKTDEQPQLIDTERPQAKEFLKLGRGIRRCDKERGDLQEEREGYAEKLRELFHETKLKVFRGAEIEITLKDVEEKVSVKGRKGTERVDE